MSSITFTIYYRILLFLIIIDLLGCSNTFILCSSYPVEKGSIWNLKWREQALTALFCAPWGAGSLIQRAKHPERGGSSRSNVHCFTSANPASLEAASGRSELCASHLTPLIFTWLFPGQRQIVSKSIGKFIVSLRTNASRPWVLLPEELLCRLPGESPRGILGGSSWGSLPGFLLGGVFLWGVFLGFYWWGESSWGILHANVSHQWKRNVV